MTVHKRHLVEMITSGGQTGADRAALDWAIRNHIKHGGWCPKGRLAEDGPIDTKYNLTETPGETYLERTAKNVRASDGSVIFTMDDLLCGGSLKTVEIAIKHRKPHLHLWATLETNLAEELKGWIKKNEIQILNVAGPRASEQPEIGQFVERVLNEAFSSEKTTPR